MQGAMVGRQRKNSKQHWLKETLKKKKVLNLGNKIIIKSRKIWCNAVEIFRLIVILKLQ